MAVGEGGATVRAAPATSLAGVLLLKGILFWL
jgi:hypothetical protein